MNVLITHHPSDQRSYVGGQARAKTFLERVLLNILYGIGLLSLSLFIWPLWFSQRCEQLLGDPGRGQWLAFSLTYVLASVIGGIYWWITYRQTSSGIKNNGIFHSDTMLRGTRGWLWGIAFTTFYVLLYWHPQPLEGWIRLMDPFALMLSGKPADQWFLYGAFYTSAVLVFGVRMLMKYRHSRYHLLRTSSLMFFQLGFAFVLPQLLKTINLPDFYFGYFWPLKPDYLLPFDYIKDPKNGIVAAQLSGYAVGRFMLIWGAVMSLILTPVLTYFFGKRWYCSWVCGCSLRLLEERV